MNPEEPKKKDILKALRTYQGDVEEIMSHNKTSITDIVIAEQNKRNSLIEGETEEKIENKAKNKFYILAGGLLLALGVITIVSVFYIKSNDKTPTPSTQENKTVISFSKESMLPVASSTREQMLSSIVRERKSFDMPVNSVLYLNTSDGSHIPAEVASVFTLLAPRIPATLVRSFGIKYMVGIYSFDTNEPFFLLTVDDYGASYAGMLEWEPDMTKDIGVLFGIKPDIGTSTPVFEDKTIKNKDLRILKDANGKTTLLYTFIDKKTLLITTNENIFGAILSKYLVNSLSH
jgi:hypothetical protein